MGSPPNVESVYRLTSTQEGILYHAAQGEVEGLYLQQFTCVLAGDLDVEQLSAAWQQTVARHAALRTLFTWKKRPHPLQVALRDADLMVEVLDRPELLASGPDLDAWLAEDRRRGIDLERAPLMRVALVRDRAGHHRLLWTFHHIALDGWSMRVVLDEVLARYDGAGPEGPAAPHESFVQWLAKQPEAEALQHWRESLAGFEHATEVFDVGRAAEPPEHVTVSRPLAAALSARVAETARAERVTLGAVMRMAWALCLRKFSGDRDVVFGATVSGRPPEISGIEGIVGMFIHTVPVRARLNDETTAADLCRQLQLAQLDAQPYETTSLAAIQRASEVAPGESLFHSILVMENHAVGGEQPHSLGIEDARYEEKSHYPLALLVVPGEEIELIAVHDRRRVSDGEAASVLDALTHILTRFVEAPASPLEHLCALHEKETQTLERWAGRTPSADPASAPLDVLAAFDAHAAAQPGDLALRCTLGPSKSMTYGELLAMTERTAAELQRRGVRPGDRVGVRLPRGANAVAAILGVLRAGAAYVPLDPDAPAARFEAMRKAAELRLVIDTDGSEPIAEFVQSSARLQEAPPADEASLAYVLFTSGTTGVPKGVEVTRAALSLSTAARDDVYGARPERFLLLSPLHFDSSIAGLFWTLTRGGTLVLPAPGDERDARRISALIGGESVTHTLMLPSLYGVCLETATAEQRRSLRTVIVAGEATPAALVRAHQTVLPGVRLENEYGPTEGTVWSTSATLHAGDSARPQPAVDPIPIGRPIGPVIVRVLDALGSPVPPGVAGELHLGGPTLARGYAGDEELTRQRFFTAPETGERLYRTGDRVRFGQDGQLLFLGRVDRQVKIRGHRVELGDVETALLSLSEVHEAAAVAARATSGQQQLVGFVSVSEDPGQDAERSALGDELRERLAAALPAAMVPQRVIVRLALPTTASGKVDRTRLTSEAIEALGTSAEDAGGRPVQGELEITLQGIWRDVLGVEGIAADANFYALGGDSLTSIRLVSRAFKAGLEIELADFAGDPTIEGMARAIRSQANSEAIGSSAARPTDSTAAPAAAPVPLTPIQRWFLAQDLPARHHWNQAVRVDVTTPGDALSGAAEVEARLRRLSTLHDALRLRFTQSTEDGRWHARTVAPGEGDVATRVIQAAAHSSEELERETRSAVDVMQTGMRLDVGPLMGAVLVAREGVVEVIVIAHHLAVDAVSWSTIVEDLREGLREGSGEAERAKGASFADWAEALNRVAQVVPPQEELDHWRRLASLPGGEWATSPGPVASERVTQTSLPAAVTGELLSSIHETYGTQVRDVLLAALSRVLARRTGWLTHVVDVEGHGREPQALGESALDVSRTVGWFTHAWPLALVEGAAPEPANAGDSIMAAKEAVRSTPRSGLGFGLLALSEDPSLRQLHDGVAARQILFNYLGQFADGSSPAAALNDAALGELRSPLGTRAYALEVNLWVEDGSLTARWSYGDSVQGTGEPEALAADYMDEIRGLVEHCKDPSAGGVTPSDFPLAHLDQGELDRIAKLLGGG